MVESEDPNNDEEKKPEEHGDADWLDELATEISEEWQEEAPQTEGSTATLLEPKAEDEIPAWLKADLEKEVASDEEVPDWLVPELANAGAIAASLDKDNSSPGSGEDESSEDIDQTLLYQPGDSSSSVKPANVLDEEELDWLNQMADDSEVDIEDDSRSEGDQESEIREQAETDTGTAAEPETGEEPTFDEQPTLESEVAPADDAHTGEKEPLPPGTGQLTWMEDIEAVEEQMRIGEEESETLPEIVVDKSVSAATEPLSMQEISGDDEATIFADVPEDPDEAMAWLEDLAAKQAASDEEVFSIEEDALQVEQDPSATEAGEAGLISEVEMEEPDLEEPDLEEPDLEEPDQEELAGEFAEMTLEVESEAAEPASLEDTLVFVPSVEHDDEVGSRKRIEETDEMDNDQEIPEDPDEAMAWLEKLAAEKGASDADLESIEAEFIEPEPDEAMAVEEVIEFEQEDSTEAAFDFASDLDEALDWLEEMVEFEEGDPSEAVAVIEEPPTPRVVHDVSAAITEAIVEEEEPKAELTGLADVIAESEDIEVTGPADESFADVEIFEEELEEKTVEPDEAITEGDEPVGTAEIEVDSAEEEVIEDKDETAEAFAWLDHLAKTEDEVPEDMATEPFEEEHPQLATEASELPAEEIIEPSAESLLEPTVAEPSEELERDLDWLDTLGGDDEQEKVDLVETADAIEPGELSVSEVPAEEVEETPEEFDSEIEEEELLEEDEAEAVVEEILRDLGQEELGFARSIMEAGEIEQAITRYESLLDDPAIVPFIIADLEAIVDQEGSQVLLKRTLGDAYVRNGQLKRALEIYRKALDSL